MSPDVPVIRRFAHALGYVAFADEMHWRFLEAPWLTAPICKCHPDVFVRIKWDVEFDGDRQ